MPKKQAILYFDGVCNLCNHWVQFVIRRDRESRFQFASLQSKAGLNILSTLKSQNNGVPDSLILEIDDNIYIRSDAALRTFIELGRGYKLAGLFLLMPGFIRDAMYNFIAKNRYSIWGKRDECIIPTHELKTKFLD
jgi:predicted DCC family thiol-disulfide oxidoreductase YuxK